MSFPTPPAAVMRALLCCAMLLCSAALLPAPSWAVSSSVAGSSGPFQCARQPVVPRCSEAHNVACCALRRDLQCSTCSTPNVDVLLRQREALPSGCVNRASDTAFEET